jgi:DHA2 family multidrug resistance protein-like MFS transporter
MRNAARHSFVFGMHVTLLVSAVLLLSGAAAALRLPRAMECGRYEDKAVAAPAEMPSPVRHESAAAVRSGRAGD